MPTLLSMWTLLACGPDPELTQKVATLEGELASAKQDLERTERERDALRARAERLQAELGAKTLELTYARLGVQPGQPLTATLSTTLGDIICELWPQHAPRTVLNFVELAEGSREWTHPSTGEKVRSPLYDGTIFHRVIPGFMVQGGDPLGNGRGGPGYKFEDEVGSGLRFDKPGLLAMANSGPDTNGSQFFITDSTPDHLDGKHTIFGSCAPVELVRTITQVPTGAADRPVQDVVLKKVTIRRG